MKKVFSLLSVLLVWTTVMNAAATHEDTSMRWHSDKYSMFIHFGIYSYYGGVWDGKPVTRGYSEQIQSHAGIYGDWYAEAAYDFRPDKFDAQEIASLARKAGMRSIVFTSKHHDGFCMFDTKTTGYDSVDMTPAGRDYVRELSQACAEAGLKFGLYFSLIDWNFPHAYPISSHNADFITAQHHQLNLAQVEELVTSYGEISELWFDMGSLTPSQSRELYDLVKKHQPSCMVSGRLGNDMYDFAVMPDNFYPDGTLQAPWQSAASMFDPTWSWRSWQERGEVTDKASEKLRSLINVVSRGGNYLLNIGPDAEGSVIDFEREVLLTIGRWLEKNAEAIYGTGPNPFRYEFPWGAVTRKGRNLYLILSGKYPEGGNIILSLPQYRLSKVLTPGVKAYDNSDYTVVEVSEEMYADPLDIKVLALEFDRDVEQVATVHGHKDGEAISTFNALQDYSYSCFDYYSNYKSTVGYGWTFENPLSEKISVFHTSQEQGRKVRFELDNQTFVHKLKGKTSSLPMAEYTLGPCHYSQMRGGTFIGPSRWAHYTSEQRAEMKLLEGDGLSMPVSGFSNHLLVRDVEVSKPGYALLEICAGNGVELVLYEKTFMKHLNPYGTKRRVETVLVYLEAGVHQLVLRAYNRFENQLELYVKSSQSKVYETVIPLGKKAAKLSTLKLKADESVPVHSDCQLHNLVVRNN